MKKKKSKIYQFLVGQYYILFGKRKTLNQFPNLSFYQIKYYKRKIKEQIHWGDHGGYRVENTKVDNITKILIKICIKMLLWVDKSLTLFELKKLILFVFEVDLSLSWFFAVLKYELNFSYKKFNQIENYLKYTRENILYTSDYLIFINNTDLKKVKFLDESHFDVDQKFVMEEVPKIKELKPPITPLYKNQFV
jgi:hypothetical protein